MPTRRIHVVGASGAGVTTLGRALADALSIPHHDTDDYYWLPTDPPYQQVRHVADRLRLMREMFLDRSDWVLSGSLDEWGGAVIALFDLVVYLTVPTDVRLERLRKREARRIGGSVGPDDPRWRESEDFIEWASHYDDGTREGRNLQRHVAWLATLHCRVIRLDGTRATDDLVRMTLAELA